MRVVQLHTIGVHRRDSTGTLPVVLKVARVTGGAAYGGSAYGRNPMDHFFVRSFIFSHNPLLIVVQQTVDMVLLYS